MRQVFESARRRQVTTLYVAQSAGGLSVLKSAIHGFGCFAVVHFPKGSTIAEYSGERINHVEAMSRMIGTNGKHISQLNADYYIDGNIGGNETQYINHSCEPNADVVIAGDSIMLFALCEIVAGEEVTVDYLNSFDQDQALCRCCTASCRTMREL